MRKRARVAIEREGARDLFFQREDRAACVRAARGFPRVSLLLLAVIVDEEFAATAVEEAGLTGED